MEKIEIRGALRNYLRLPLYMVIPIVIFAIGLIIYDRMFIWPSFAMVAVYGVVALVAYVLLRSKCIKSLAELTISIDDSQKDMLLNMPVPYVMINKTGAIMWKNKCYIDTVKELFKEEEKNNISQVFPEITKETLKALNGESIERDIHFNGKVYSLEIHRINGQEYTDEEVSFYGVMFFDKTSVHNLREQLDEEKLVVASVFIDNYEETIEETDDVKNSLIAAVVERKIRKYFGEADGIIRKLEKDKYFIVFPKKFLSKLIDNKFAILEDIKNTKVGTEAQVTLSIGMGLNGGSYVRDAEYAKTAINLALGRGGSQVVVKDGGDVSIYGTKGKEVSKNTRVKARVKAQALRELISSREQVIIMGHKISDFDCLGASIGVSVAAKEMGKPCHIVINTVTKSLRPLMETFATDDSYGKGLFINSEEAKEIVDKKTLVVIVDTNRPGILECPEILNMTKDIVVFDHHRQGKDKIEAPLLSYIEPFASSTCEMVAEILQYFSENIRITPKEADALYAGMLIDTNNFMTKTGVRTFEAAAYLKRSGAEVTRVRKLLREDINAYRARAEVVRNAEVYKDAFAIAVCDTAELESPTVVGAQASNELLNIVGIKASFVLTEFNDKIYVSSRSIDEIDVQVMMERLGGGGHLNVAGAQIENSSIEKVRADIRNLIDTMIQEELIR